MLTIELINDGTGNERRANYRYRVLVNGRELASGVVKDHDRTTRWWGLISDLARQVERDQQLAVFAELAEYMQRRNIGADALDKPRRRPAR